MIGKLKKSLINLSLLMVSTVISLLVVESALRMVFDPVDYLSPKVVRDEILGMKLPPGSGGHDSWGFRNSDVPDSADIVAIGDSHTYGNCARMSESWPHVLARLSGHSVYNLGMGGYGPNQYFYLLESKAFKLNPKIVICGLYMGDDFDNAFRITYDLDYWTDYRKGEFEKKNSDIWESSSSPHPTLNKRLRVWLSQNSVLYRLTVHGLLQKLKARIQMDNAERLYASSSVVNFPELGRKEAFSPGGLLEGLDQNRDSVREGMRLTLEFLRRMQSATCGRSVRFVVAIIPTKESIFADFLTKRSDYKFAETIKSVIANEELARSQVISELQQAKIEYVDLLPGMKAAALTERIHIESPADMHPNKSGYRVIARELASVVAVAKN